MVAVACQTKGRKERRYWKLSKRTTFSLWFEDRKHVVFLSTHDSGRPVKNMSRRNRDCATPDCIRQYNQYMGGVDLSDMRIYFFQDERRTKRWNVKVFFHLFGQISFNAFIVYRSNTAVPMSYHKFLESCLDGLVDDFRIPRSTMHTVPLPLIPLQLPHPLRLERLIYQVDQQIVKFPANVSNCCCKVCLGRGDKERKVTFCCKCCNVGLCVVNCFWS